MDTGGIVTDRDLRDKVGAGEGVFQMKSGTS